MLLVNVDFLLVCWTSRYRGSRLAFLYLQVLNLRDPKYRGADDSESLGLALLLHLRIDLRPPFPRSQTFRGHLSHHQIPTHTMQNISGRLVSHLRDFTLREARAFRHELPIHSTYKSNSDLSDSLRRFKSSILFLSKRFSTSPPWFSAAENKVLSLQSFLEHAPRAWSSITFKVLKSFGPVRPHFTRFNLPLLRLATETQSRPALTCTAQATQSQLWA
jgi:hypothetical protein